MGVVAVCESSITSRIVGDREIVVRSWHERSGAHDQELWGWGACGGVGAAQNEVTRESDVVDLIGCCVEAGLLRAVGRCASSLSPSMIPRLHDYYRMSPFARRRTEGEPPRGAGARDQRPRFNDRSRDRREISLLDNLLRVLGQDPAPAQQLLHAVLDLHHIILMGS